MSQVKHNCGLNVTHTLHDAYSMGNFLQHRGREAAGYSGIGYNGKMDVVKIKGPIRTLDLKALHKIFPGHLYHTFMVHVRYATRGRKERILEEAHPITIGGKVNDLESHIIITGCGAVMVHNGQVNNSFTSIHRPDLLKTRCDTERLLYHIVKNNEFDFIRNIPGSYTLAFAEKNRGEIVVMRDPLGMHPGVLGEKDGKVIVSSEDMAIEKNGGRIIEDLEPGSIYYLTPEGGYRKERIINNKKIASCMFEFQYFMSEESTSDFVNVLLHRKKLGRKCAEEFSPEDIDFVTYVPRCSEPAAKEYARAIDRPFIDVFYKLTGERSFLGSTKTQRKKSIDENLFLCPEMEEIIRDKTLFVMEDSIVRGNVRERVRHLLYDKAKVRKAYLYSYTPPLCIRGKDGVDRGCMFGIDMPPKPPKGEKYVARGRTLKELKELPELPIRYLSLKGMFEVFEESGMQRQNLCSYCLGGEHPFTRLTLKHKIINQHNSQPRLID